MIDLPETHVLQACAARRRALSRELGGRPALIASGAPRPRNYAANVYPFRASSHFLYLTGLAMPHAFLLVSGGEATLFVEPAEADHALWHGPTPSEAELAAATGLAVRPLSALAKALPADTASVVPPDADTAEVVQGLLGRPAGGEPLHPLDAALADALIALRLVHDAAAQAGMREAVEATVAAHAAGMRVTAPGRREWTVRAAMEAEIGGRGMTTAYGSIVTVHGEVLHNDTHHGVLRDGDLLLCDVGAESRGGWASDVTRTWPVNGRFSPTQRAIYEVVLASQAAAIETARAGTRYRDVHLAACHALARGLVSLGILRGDPAELVADDVHALFFPHGIGHLLGLDVHDMEDLGDRAGYAPGRLRSGRFGLRYLRLDRDLMPGMSVTIEPGFYQVPAMLEDPERLRAAGDRLNRAELAKFTDVRGIRIEDDILIAPLGAPPVVMTAAIPKRCEDIEAVMRG